MPEERKVDENGSIPEGVHNPNNLGDAVYRRLFVGGLPHGLTVEELKTYFDKFGQVLECNIPFDHFRQQPRGFGFVTYDSIEIVKDVMEKRAEHFIKGKWVDC